MRLDAPASWIWRRDSAPARAARRLLLPAAGLYRAFVTARAHVYQRGWLPRQTVGVPVIAVGNLTVGGTGKTPVASWIAGFCAERGIVPGIVSRGYGPDEGQVHRERTPSAVVIEGKDRPAAARAAVELGAEVVVLDDGFQRLDLARDLNILLVSADSAGSRHLLPGGPWREPWSAARRADLVVVTRKRAGRAEITAAVARVGALGFGQDRIALASLHIESLRDLDNGRATSTDVLRGARVLAVCGVADPDSFTAQLAAQGAWVQVRAFPDHHSYSARDVEALVSAAREADYVVVTHKDAVKLRPLWPRSHAGVWVAHLGVAWEQGGSSVAGSISDLLTSYYGPAIYKGPDNRYGTYG